MTTVTEDLHHLGWGEDLQAHLDALNDPDLLAGRIVVEHRIRYQVWTASGPVWAWPPQGMRRKVTSLDKPGVGDWVALQPGTGGDIHQIASVLPRRTQLVRQAAGDHAEPQLVAANLDAVFVVTSMNQDFNLRRIERYLSVIRAGGAVPVILLNKADLASPGEQERYLDRARAALDGVEVVATSALAPDQLSALQRWLGPGKTVGLVGSSGVGKSSLVNALIGQEAQAVGDIRARDDHGRHTTTHRELLLLPNDQGVLIDTPGMRELQLWSGAAIDEVFPDIVALLDDNCQFRDCRHNGEPGCAIAEALEDGSLGEDRWASYRKLKAESAVQAAKRARLAQRSRRLRGQGGRPKGKKKKKR